MKIVLKLLLPLFALSAFAQDSDEYWTRWDKNYPETNIRSVLKFEKLYADSVEKDPELLNTMPDLISIALLLNTPVKSGR